jgi:hypothetical protein
MELEIAVKASEIMLNTHLSLEESIKKAIEIIGGEEVNETEIDAVRQESRG